jgi:hypothetical protein
MGFRLRHPGYVEGEVISGIIMTQALLTIAALWFRRVSILLDLRAWLLHALWTRQQSTQRSYRRIEL